MNSFTRIAVALERLCVMYEAQWSAEQRQREKDEEKETQFNRQFLEHMAFIERRAKEADERAQQHAAKCEAWHREVMERVGITVKPGETVN